MSKKKQASDGVEAPEMVEMITTSMRRFKEAQEYYSALEFDHLAELFNLATVTCEQAINAIQKLAELQHSAENL